MQERPTHDEVEARRELLRAHVECCTVTFWAGISCRIVVLMSSDVTLPDEPTRPASHSVMLPLPPPSSRQRQPEPTPMASR